MAAMRSVVVTGASSGIGYATAALLIQKGYRVFGSVRRAADAKRLSETLGADMKPLLFDVTDEGAVAAAAEEVGAQLEGATLAGLVNNAGIAVTGPMLQVSAGDFRRQLEVNLAGPFIVTRCFAPLLGAARGRHGEPGRIVNLGSSAGVIAVPFMGPYAVSKHGLEGFSDTLRRELALYGIRVVTVGPGVVETPFVDKTLSAAAVPPPESDFVVPFRKYGEEALAMRKAAVSPERVASVILTALTARRPKSRYAVVGGRWRNWILPRLVPSRLLDRYIAHRLGLRP
jgi:NAD(P)-dependent dehydrogenase (short-subunit alcohol dehydrogenase family)